jgi:hypothetical protein
MELSEAFPFLLLCILLLLIYSSVVCLATATASGKDTLDASICAIPK